MGGEVPPRPPASSPLARLSQLQKATIGGIIAVVITIVVLIVVLTGGGNTYLPNVQTNFLKPCEASGSSTSRCACGLSNIEANVSLAAFEKAEVVIESADETYPSWMLNAIRSCG